MGDRQGFNCRSSINLRYEIGLAVYKITKNDEINLEQQYN